MAVEIKDPVSRKYILYRSQAAHSVDCGLHPFELLPTRIFLDTSIINTLVKYAALIFENEPGDSDMDVTLAEDVECLSHVFAAGSHAPWELVSSHAMLDELSQTRSVAVREALLDYGINFVDACHPNEAWVREDFSRRLLGSQLLEALPDEMDRRLLAHSIVKDCDTFCTRDRITIISRRHLLPRMPVRILTPREWWGHLKPWMGLFC